jgi:hypothetical protein
MLLVADLLLQERLAAAQAAEMIVRQSLNAGGGRMTGPRR